MMIKKFCCAFAASVCVFCLFACSGGRSEGMEKQYYFEEEDEKIIVGGDMDMVIERLGHYNSMSVAPSCAGEGCDEVYVYNGFKINVHRDGELALINEIELTNDTVSTKEGISIGDTYEKVIETYGEGERFSGGVEYTDGICRLRFFMRNGKVVGVKYAQGM